MQKNIFSVLTSSERSEVILDSLREVKLIIKISVVIFVNVFSKRENIYREMFMKFLTIIRSMVKVRANFYNFFVLCLSLSQSDLPEVFLDQDFKITIILDYDLSETTYWPPNDF